MRAFLILPIIALSALSCGFGAGDDARIASVIIDPGVTPIALRNMDDSGRAIGSIGRLKALVESRGRRLHFAMNGGMYMEDQRPLGLYVEDGRTVRKLVTRTDGYGNFYLNPNGVFGVDSTGKAFVVTTAEYPSLRGVRQATQSGPMLVVDGRVNAAFDPRSTNLNIRNGVGILPDGRALFAISRVTVSFHDFARFFQEHGCREALFLDGTISRAYMPEAGLEQMDGVLGPLIVAED
ncbi:MAG TPA: phosphodiester glycosidase family protein [Flavobacteriales bacterium]|nr:phosphodiester glycosidase family protein [Flavobacteriales bacterium]HNE79188.1 phosphodiester glycosidase family protein [Flavobacteriales bacterium]HNI05261.1 phosphodiester glycosidase family protein [Flavobacteriales bacterium]HNK40110.1 phosphodiester glycosidase family protein [Flavobacteriales bacterium]HNK68529.1 phosphodiester glycosidase family protein [Flavobacteriales bacterium]